MFKAASKTHISSALRRIADDVEKAKISPKEAVLRLHRVKMALSQTAEQALEAMGPMQANSREEVMKGFKSANPDLTDEQLEEIADQWEKNKDVVKDKTAAVKTKADFTKLHHQMQADLDTFDMAWGRYEKDPEKNSGKLDDALKYMRDLRDLADVLISNMTKLKER